MGKAVENSEDFTVHERRVAFKTNPEVFCLVTINWDDPETSE